MAKLIAEIGINHFGNKANLLSMISELKANNIDSCKLQYRGKNDFFDQSLEMGSTLISEELKRVNMSLADTVKAVRYAKSIGIEIGVSFFRISDAETFLQHELPDYFKVPSAESMNFELINFLKKREIPVYVSTGGLTYNQLQLLAEEVQFSTDDCVMYCVANYPAGLGTSVPSYINEYKKLFNCKIGYSSHDDDWELNVAFLDRGVDMIERHYTRSKLEMGLDVSTSSTMDELVKLQKFCSSGLWTKKMVIEDKIPNQGEIQNIKDLGSGYYFKQKRCKGELIKLNELEVKSPCRGIKAGTSQTDFILVRDAISGEALTQSHIEKRQGISPKTTSQCDAFEVSLPVRLHDFDQISNTFQIKNFEWHLSFQEVLIAEENILSKVSKIKNKKFSIHLPDYISANALIDPLSRNTEIKQRSREVIETVARLGKKLQQITGDNVPIVGSFSVLTCKKDEFYSELSSEIFKQEKKHEVKIRPQFLPKKAWYFGGSVELNAFCNIQDIKYFQSLPFGLCLDSAHCIMAANFFEEDPSDWIDSLIPFTEHLHISDAIGIDGEGVPFGRGALGQSLDKLLKLKVRKVIEQWEGHLNDFAGFKDAMNFIVGVSK